MQILLQMMVLNSIKIKQGEVWLCNFEPQVGSEITKIRPAVVVSADSPTSFNTRIIVPITSWRDKFEGMSYMVKIQPDLDNGLDDLSAANCLQIKSFDCLRFVRKLGAIDRKTHLTIALSLFGLIKP